MRVDLYTKTILSVIMFLLAVIVLRPLGYPTVTARAEGQFEGLQFSGNPSGFWLFDSRSGEAWLYEITGGPPRHLKIEKLGEPWKHVDKQLR